VISAGPGCVEEKMSDINLRRAGHGEPVLLVHGIGGELHVWDPIFERLACKRDVIAVDLPGFGESRPLADGVEPSPGALARALGDLLDDLGLAGAHVVGNSLGGWIALELARQHRARSVLALSPAGLWSAPLLGADAPAHNVTRRAGLVLLPALRALIATRAGRRLVFSRVMAHPERLDGVQAQRMLDAFVRAPAYEVTNAAMRRRRADGLAEIRVPVTVAWSERDRIVRRSARVPPTSRVVELPGAGHIPMWDNPEGVIALALEMSGAGSPNTAPPPPGRRRPPTKPRTPKPTTPARRPLTPRPPPAGS
jgi:pimeloyl-ACP methyl ester carboxylesterase